MTGPVPIGIGARPSYPPAGGRRQRHRPVIALIWAYLAAALGAVLAPHLVAMPRWLALHLLFLGAASKAIVVYSAHFAEALLGARPARRGWVRAQLAGLNAGVLAVLVGVDAHHPWPVVVGAVLVGGAVLAGAGRLVRLARHSLAARLRATVWFYVAAAGFLAAGAASGALLGSGEVSGAGPGQYLVAFHAHVNLFGWVGLTVLGTLFLLWPAALRTRMAPEAPQVAWRVLVVCIAGLMLAGVALLAAHPGVAAVGMAGYTVGVGLSLGPFLRVARQRLPRDLASWSLAAATGWLVAALCWDIAALTTAGRHVERVADRLAPLLAIGLVAQVLVGALSFLLPVLLGGGLAVAKRMAVTLNRGWVSGWWRPTWVHLSAWRRCPGWCPRSPWCTPPATPLPWPGWPASCHWPRLWWRVARVTGGRGRRTDAESTANVPVAECHRGHDSSLSAPPPSGVVANSP